MNWKDLIGKSIVFLIPAGRSRHGQEYAEKSGRVTLAFDTHCVVNGGGRHGTPFVVDDNNFVKVGRLKKPRHHAPQFNLNFA